MHIHTTHTPKKFSVSKKILEALPQQYLQCCLHPQDSQGLYKGRSCWHRTWNSTSLYQNAWVTHSGVESETISFCTSNTQATHTGTQPETKWMFQHTQATHTGTEPVTVHVCISIHRPLILAQSLKHYKFVSTYIGMLSWHKPWDLVCFNRHRPLLLAQHLKLNEFSAIYTGHSHRNKAWNRMSLYEQPLVTHTGTEPETVWVCINQHWSPILAQCLIQSESVSTYIGHSHWHWAWNGSSLYQHTLVTHTGTEPETVQVNINILWSLILALSLKQ